MRRGPRTLAVAPRTRERGFALVAAVFVLVILASVVAWLGTLRIGASQAVVLEMRQARAMLAARSALQWAAWKVRDPQGTGTPGVMELPPCFVSPTVLSLPGSLAEFDVTVSCVRTPAATDAPPYLLEDLRRIAVYSLVVTASIGAPATPERVERRIEMLVETCRDAASSAVNFAC